MSDRVKEVVAGILRLEALELLGLDDSPDADAVRDGLEAAWYALTDPEQAAVRKYSSGLNRLAKEAGLR